MPRGNILLMTIRPAGVIYSIKQVFIQYVDIAMHDVAYNMSIFCNVIVCAAAKIVT